MQRKKSFIIIGIVAAIIIVVGSAVAYTPPPRRVPSETELPDQTVISNLKDVKEVKAFLSKYPNATVFVDRSGGGRIIVGYSLTNLSKLNATALDLEKDESGRTVVVDKNGIKLGDYHYISLGVYVDDKGMPQEMEIQCFDGQDVINIRDNILNYIETETCLES